MALPEQLQPFNRPPATVLGRVAPTGDVVCMSKDHADAYAELFAACEAADRAPLSSSRTASGRVCRAMERLRALAAPESNRAPTPPPTGRDGLPH